MHQRAKQLIEELGLTLHPEGGWYREVFRSKHRVQADEERGWRTALTTIYYLLTAGRYSRFHRVLSDEVWHFYEGAPLELVWINETGMQARRSMLGPVNDDSSPVRVVRAGCWQAAQTTGDYTLVGCTVGPGFEFADFALLADLPTEAERVRERHPQVARLI